MTLQVSRTTHSIFLRLAQGDALVDALVVRLREAGVAAGTLEGHGVLEDVELRTFAAETRTLGASRRIAGAVHVIAAFATVGLSQGTPQFTLRAILSRETDTGIETLSGVVVQARVLAFEAHVVSAQDLALPLAYDARAGLPMVDVQASPAPPPAAWADAIATSQAQPALKPVASMQAQIPPRPPARPVTIEEGEQILPEAGDEVQHFAFGKCEVVKSDGDRLHLRIGKDTRVREIALEMLKVTLLDPDPTQRPRHFRLDRRL